MCNALFGGWRPGQRRMPVGPAADTSAPAGHLPRTGVDNVRRHWLAVEALEYMVVPVFGRMPDLSHGKDGVRS